MAKLQKALIKQRSRPLATGKLHGKAEHGTSLQIAYQGIRELIVHGRMSPGTWIVEEDLAERLNMSRTPVRQAIHWLQLEGYVLEQRYISKSRMVVAPLTKDDANALYSIIGRLEGLAGRGAALMSLKQRNELTTKLRSINKQLLTISKGRGKGAGGIFDLDRDFHRSIVIAGAGPRLSTLHSAIEPQAERYWRLYASSITDNLHESLVEHDTIVKGIAAGDPDSVERGLQLNWEKGAERLAHVIDIFGERGSW